MSLSKNPAYNLKAVLKETNIAADTLRAWERRYGLPMPQRTAGGHRHYSQYDIETIKWLLARQAEGLSISRAVDSWNEKIASNVDPLAGFIPSVLSSTQTTPAIYISPDTNLDSLRAQWIAACMKFSESSSEQVLNQAFSMFPVESVCMEVLQKGLSEVGGLWYENKASVQQEHFTSALAARKLDTLINASPMATRSQTILVGCPAGEWHTFTPQLISLFLRRRGLYVIYLGANVPADQFEDTIQAIQADLVVLVSQQLITSASLQQTAQMLLSKKIPVAFGGRIFSSRPQIIRRISGYYLGKDMEEAIGQIESLSLASARVQSPQAEAVSREYVIAHQAFTSKRIHIESTMKELAQSFAIPSADLDTGIHFLGDNITAALQLGDMEHVTDEMEWVKVLMQSHKRSPQELAYFIETYSQAVDKHINGQGEPIKAWLKTQVTSA